MKTKWSGRVNKNVWASNRYLCPICKEAWGGEKDEEPKSERVCDSHIIAEFKDMPKKVWPRWAK